LQKVEQKGGKESKTSSLRSLGTSQQQEVLQGMTKAKSQYFGGKINQIASISASAVQLN